MKLKDLLKEEIKMGEFLNLLKPFGNKFKNSTANAVANSVNDMKNITGLIVVKPGFGLKDDEIQYWINNHGQQFIGVSKNNKNLEKILSIAKSNNIYIEK